MVDIETLTPLEELNFVSDHEESALIRAPLSLHSLKYSSLSFSIFSLPTEKKENKQNG